MGGGRKQYQVLVDPTALHEHGVTLGDVDAALKANNVNFTGGYADVGGMEKPIRVIGRLGPDPAQVIAELKMIRSLQLRVNRRTKLIAETAAQTSDPELLRLLQELADREEDVHRITRDTLIASLWVDGNYQAWRRKRMEQRRNPNGLGGRRPGRFVVPRAQIEREFHSVGFDILSHLDLLPGFAMWRVYVLRKTS